MTAAHLTKLTLAFVLALVSSGCYATVRGRGGYGYVETAPIAYESYPYVMYEGRPVYHVHDRWYYRNGSRWDSYHAPPAALYRSREIRRQAPPAYYRHDHHERREYHERRDHHDHHDRGGEHRGHRDRIDRR
jgi:hypothetical protein